MINRQVTIRDINQISIGDWVYVRIDNDDSLYIGYVTSKNNVNSTFNIKCIRMFEDGEEIRMRKPRNYTFNVNNNWDYTIYTKEEDIPKEWKASIINFALDTKDELWFYQLTS